MMYALLIALALCTKTCFTKPNPQERTVGQERSAILTHSVADPDAKQFYHIMLFNLSAAHSKTAKCSKLLKKIHAHNPSFSSPALVSFLFSTEQFKEAEIAANNYRKLYGNDDWSVNFTAARALCAQQKNDLAEAMFHEAQRTAKKSWAHEQTTYAQAIFYVQTHKPTLALQEIDRFLESNPTRTKHAPFYILKATIHLGSSHPNLDVALEELNKGLELNPHQERALKLKALVLEQQDKKPELVEVLKKIIEIDHNPAFSKKLVSLQFELGKFKDAYVTLAKVNEKTPNHLFDLALISWKLKENERAISHINDAIKLDPEFSRARLLKLEIFLSSDRKKEAMHHLREWILADHNTKVFSILGMLTSAQLLSVKESITLLEPLKNHKLVQKEVHSFLGDLYTLVGNFTAADTSYRRFMKTLAKNDANLGIKAFYNLGYLQWKQGNVNKALGEITKAHAIAPKNSLISGVLAFLYTQQHDKSKIKLAKELLKATSINSQQDEHLQFNSLIAAQEKAYKFSPFWSHLDKITPKIEDLMLDGKITATHNTTR
ncbi:hypothetical protein FJ366_02705 [Candidatus Dependentiae bacterium]|nr:hypothetical protein [Candidatus Dependentiae bacterium]